MVARAVLPTLLAEHEHGEGEADIWLVTGVFALPSVGDAEGPREDWEKEWEMKPVVPRGIVELMGR